MTRPLAALFALSLGIVGCASSAPPATVAAQQPAAQPPPDNRPRWFGKVHKATPQAEVAPRVVPLSDPGRVRRNERSALGTNLAPVRYDSRAWVFTNVFRMSSPWVSRSASAWNDGQPLEQDDMGWVQSLLPGQAAATRFPTLKGGEFVVLYEGRGIITIENATFIAEKPGRIVFEAPADQSVVLTITEVNAANHIRNITVVPLQFEGSHDKNPFHPAFVERISRFSVLRFTDWTRVQGSRVASWSKRATPHEATQASRRGVAFEHMIHLSNEVWAEPWLSIPHLADDDYIRELATLLRDNLEPKLRVHLEYSHEVWRSPETSRQAAYCSEQGTFLGLGDGDPVKAQLAFAARRTLEVFRIFEHVLGEARVVRVISEPLAESPRRLSLQEELQGKVEVIAVPAWVGIEWSQPEMADRLKKASADDIASHLELKSIPNLVAEVRAAAQRARSLGVRLVSYTGGTYLVAPPALRRHPGANAALTAASRSARMKVLYGAILARWKEAGGNLFVHAPLIKAYGRKGRFSALETQDQPLTEAPKFQALLRFVEETPRWWKIDYQPPAQQGVQLDPQLSVPPENRRALAITDSASNRDHLVWASGGAAVGALALGTVFTGLYLSSAGDRDRNLAESNFDAASIRSQDNAAFTQSAAQAASYSIAGAGGVGAAVLWLTSDHDPKDARLIDPPQTLLAAAGLVSLIASGVYFAAYRSTLSQRDDRLAADRVPLNSRPLRALEDEATAWSIASSTSLLGGLASLGSAVWAYFATTREPYARDYEAAAAAASAGALY